LDTAASPRRTSIMLIARVFALSLAAFAVARGQGNGLGSIRGTAVDPTGSIIPDVEIMIVDLNRTTLTTRNGWFVWIRDSSSWSLDSDTRRKASRPSSIATRIEREIGSGG